ncbi:MAG TPA: nucleotidyl transferase AbiEii/AbiGii toxin family protein [Thermoanaerobacterales bacterium]|nr:nucleotidyl transferase AbiEii/AbiGii toxin family protein [Thermoanaerobacterales bacterium]
MSDIAASVLAKLKNKAKKQGIPLQQLLNLFCQEEFIRRLSRSNYKENLILKGGFLLYSISGFTTRPTVDADYLLKDYSNDLDAIEKLVREVISLPSKNDFVEFQIRGLELISEIKKYHGIRVNLTGTIGRTKTPFSIDFGVGDIIVPSPVERTLPVLLSDFEKPLVLTYSLESTVAEKLDVIISLMEATGRMKDFYDIYYLATTFDFDGRKLQEAIYETLSNRGTPYEKDSIAVIARLAKDEEIKKRWDNFCKKILKYELDFTGVVKIIIDFILPPYESIIKEDEFFKNWSYKDRNYI